MPDSRALTGLGVPAQVAELLGSVPQVLAAAGTNQAGAAALTTKNVSVNAQTSQTGVYLPTATASPIASRELYAPYYLNYSTLSTTSPIVYVGVGGYMNGVLNGSITLASGQAAIAWQQAPGLYYSVKTALPSAPSYVASAVHFDGATEIGLTNQALGLAADAYTGTVACWLNGSDIFNSGGNGNGVIFIDTNNAVCFVGQNGVTANDVYVAVGNLAGNEIWNYPQPGGSSSFIAPSTWFLYLSSWDMSAHPGKMQVYFGDTGQTFNPAHIQDQSPFLCGYSDSAWEFFGSAFPGRSQAVICDAADFQMWCGNTFLDLTVSANRRLFIDASGKPVNPSVAAAALGQQTVLLSGDATTFANNQGTASATSVLAGTLTNAATHP